MFFYGCKIHPEETLVKDTIQELFISLWEKRQNLGDVLSVKGYLLASFRRRLAKQLEKSKKNISLLESFEMDALAFSQFSEEELLIETEEKHEKAKRLTKCLNRLTKKQMEIVYLRFYNNLDYKEIAQIVGLKYQSTRNYAHKALKKLKRSYKGQ